MHPTLLRITLLVAFAAPSVCHGLGSVTVPRQEGHFAFTASWPATAAAGKRSRTIVPLDDRLGNASGLIGQLFITVDWWTLFGEPVENYVVEWTGNGRFQVKDSTGATVTVTREDVARYPDLKLRFAQLKPKALDFTVWYRLDFDTVLSKADRATLNQRYKRIRQHAGNLYDAERLVKNSQFLIAGDGATPLSAPGSHAWDQFIRSEVNTSYNAGRLVLGAEKQVIAETFKRARSIDIMNVRVVRLEMPEAEMRTIADKLRRYREGKADPTPLEQIAAAQQEEVRAYTAKDEWAQVAERPRPPEPPKPRRDSDGLFYFYFADGQKAFPKGFVTAEAYCAEPYQVAKVRIGNSSKEENRWNFIDLEGNPVLPFDSNRDPGHWGSGLFSLNNPQRGDVINNTGLYDAIKKTFILPMEFNWVTGGDWIDKAHRNSPPARSCRLAAIPTLKNTTAIRLVLVFAMLPRSTTSISGRRQAGC